MSLSTTANKVVYDGNDAATVFDFSFPIPETSQLSVVYTDADGVETTLGTTAYSVTGIGSTDGGAVTYPLTGSPIATGTKLTIVRTVELTQPTVLSNQSNYSPTVTEAALDRITMLLQQIQNVLDRSLVVPVSDDDALDNLPTAALRANGVLAFDGDGQPYIGTTSGVTGASAYATDTLLPAVSAIAARIALGFSAIAAKGDLLAGTALNTIGTLTVGSNGKFLVADSGETAGLKWKMLSVAQQVFTASGTYTPTTGMIYCMIECWGAGGGGGGAVVAGTANQVATGGGGGAGGYSRKLASASDIGASKTVTIGAAGPGGSAGNNAGTAGGDTSVGALCIGKGGGAGGGHAGTSATAATAGAGGVAGTGDVIGVGQDGDIGTAYTHNVISRGGNSSLGNGGAAGGAGVKADGGGATWKGAGGGGGYAPNGTSNAAGGAGGAGYVVVTEWVVA